MPDHTGLWVGAVTPGDPWSFQRWAYRTRVGNPVRKSVLMVLATMADANTGRCEPLQETLAEACETSDRTIREHLKTLEAAGVISRRRQHRFDGSRRGDEFLLLAPWVTEWPDGVKIAQPEVASGPTGSGDLPEDDDRSNRKPASAQERPVGTTSSISLDLEVGDQNESSTSPIGANVVPSPHVRVGAREGAGARGRKSKPDPDALPSDFPESLLDPLASVMRSLTFAAESRGSSMPARAAVARAMMKPERARKPFVAVAERVEHWLVYGNGQRAACRDVVARWRDWCDQEADYQPLAPGVQARGGNVHPIGRRPTRFEEAQAGLAALHAQFVAEGS